MSPGDLGQALQGLPPVRDPRVLVGPGTWDDAAVYRLSDEQALVQSVDVFTPVVDDPYTFGQVAAANSLSDIYAMGARPIFAVCVIGFPAGKLPLSDMALILKGGADKTAEAGIEIVGGHSLDDSEPKYGLCVTGVVHPDRVVTNGGARPGDLLVLTKSLGIGILTHALKKGLLGEDGLKEVVRVMVELNREAAEAMVETGVSACTDVTGFGLAGHLLGMLAASGVSARVRLDRVPVLEGTREMVDAGVFAGGTRKNLEFYNPRIDWQAEIEAGERLILADAQTSGGLLMAVPAARVEDLIAGLARRKVRTRAVIGEVLAGRPGRLEVVRA
jgi:selenide, water dikinase